MKHLCLFLINIYQVSIGCFKPHTCRFTPTCSAYAKEAFQTHGFIKGGWLTLCRLLRCRPGGKWGYDPVPKK